jgi:phage I-like protein
MHLGAWMARDGAASDYLSGTMYREIVEMLVPELQARGLFQTDYEHDTLRANLGLSAPAELAATP